MARRSMAALVGACACFVLATLRGQAQTPSDDAALWRQHAQTDLEAAYRLIVDNHPGAVPALHDEQFLRALGEGYALARTRAAQVSTRPGYTNLLAGFAGSFGDDHITFRLAPGQAPNPVRWAGYIMALRGDNYTVASVDPAEPAAVVPGDRLASCDRVPAAALAERRLAGFFGDWSSRARRYLVAPYLLIDTANPFVPRPTVCTFEHGDRTVDVALAWRDIARPALAPLTAKAAPYGEAGFGVRQFAGGYWIGLQALDERAGTVLSAVRAQIDAIRKAPMVVVDVRGNGGGSSHWGDQLASELWGAGYLPALAAGMRMDPSCGTFWRATPDNVKTVQSYRAHPEKFGDNPELAGIEAGMMRAIAAHEPFAGDYVRCAGIVPRMPNARIATLPPAALQGKVVIVSDAVCFSSCLIMLGEFKAFGALHAGQESRIWSHYMEVRDQALPSGIGMFSTLQAVNLSVPARIGPFVPDLPYPGDISATAALEKWLRGATAALDRKPAR